MLGKEGGLKSFEQVTTHARHQQIVTHAGRGTAPPHGHVHTLCAGERNPAAPGDVHRAERLADPHPEGQAL